MEDISPWRALPLLEKILSSGSLGLKHPSQLKAHPSAKLFFHQSNDHEAGDIQSIMITNSCKKLKNLTSGCQIQSIATTKPTIG